MWIKTGRRLKRDAEIKNVLAISEIEQMNERRSVATTTTIKKNIITKTLTAIISDNSLSLYVREFLLQLN